MGSSKARVPLPSTATADKTPSSSVLHLLVLVVVLDLQSKVFVDLCAVFDPFDAATNHRALELLLARQHKVEAFLRNPVDAALVQAEIAREPKHQHIRNAQQVTRIRFARNQSERH